jgi:hypothetical protein
VSTREREVSSVTHKVIVGATSFTRVDSFTTAYLQQDGYKEGIDMLLFSTYAAISSGEYLMS